MEKKIPDYNSPLFFWLNQLRKGPFVCQTQETLGIDVVVLSRLPSYLHACLVGPRHGHLAQDILVKLEG